MCVRERTGLERLQSMISAVNQSIKFGIPLAESLCRLTAGARMVRISRLEEQGARLSVTLLLPAMVFILPYLFLVIGEPIGLRADEAFSSAFERVTASP
jgi:tight adherence protein C